MRILMEAAGCMTAAYIIKKIKEAGHVCVATDCNPNCYGRYLADEFYAVPLASDMHYADYLYRLAVEKKVDMVLATLDDGLPAWSKIKDRLQSKNIEVALQEQSVLDTCLDKWNTYQFFCSNGIPTPRTSLVQEYPLVKPRRGRGGEGVRITDSPIDMEQMVSQEVLYGEEYTVDVLCNRNHEPVYIVPRKRLVVREGKSTSSVTEKNETIEKLAGEICKAMPIVGAVNMQCFVTDGGKVYFTEINPRLGGGSILAMEATENWVDLLVRIFVEKKDVTAGNIKYGLGMDRYYEEVFHF